MKKICILTQSHLCRNPRVVKESITLSKAGYDVSVLTTFTYLELLREDLSLLENTGVRLKGIVNMIPGQTSGWNRIKNRLTRRIAGELIGRLKIENINALGYDYPGNMAAAEKENADLYICHQEISTVIGCKLIKKGFRVAFDLEDWYSHDLLPEANRTRPLKILEKYERMALCEGALCYTTSYSLAEALAHFANASTPKVLLNVFPFGDRDRLDHRISDRVDLSKPSIHWYSQTIGPGRGIEFLTESLEDVETPVEFHLRGNIYPGFREQLLSRFPSAKGHGLFFHSLVPHRELLSRIAEHDIGLATEENTPPSRDLTITNKILQYLLGGIAVIASETNGQKEVAAGAPGAVFLFKNRDRHSLSDLLNSLLRDKNKLNEARILALNAAQDIFCWEKQEPKLLSWVEKAFKDSM